VSPQNASGDPAVSSTVNPLTTKRSKVKTEAEGPLPISPSSQVAVKKCQNKKNLMHLKYNNFYRLHIPNHDWFSFSWRVYFLAFDNTVAISISASAFYRDTNSVIDYRQRMRTQLLINDRRCRLVRVRHQRRKEMHNSTTASSFRVRTVMENLEKSWNL